MKLTDLNVVDFINEVDSNKAAPGGGSVSSLASSMGVALASMVGKLSVKKKKYKALDESIRIQFEAIMDTFTNYKEQFIKLVDEDTNAFNLIMDAFKLPKETEEEKAFRKMKIEEGTLEAIKVPYEVASLSLLALERLDFVLEYGNRNTVSDLGVGALMLYTGLEGAILNVKINIPGISDAKTVEKYSTEAAEMLQKGKELKDSILEKVHNKL